MSKLEELKRKQNHLTSPETEILMHLITTSLTVARIRGQPGFYQQMDNEMYSLDT